MLPHQELSLSRCVLIRSRSVTPDYLKHQGAADEWAQYLKPYAVTRYGHGQIRTYNSEPLYIAASLQQRQYLVELFPSHKSKPSRYTSWYLTFDLSLRGIAPAAVHWHLSDRIPDEATARQRWDSYGMELVSRVLPAPPENTDNPFKEIEAVLSAVRGSADSKHGMAISKACGNHIHVGLSPVLANGDSPQFDLKTLQHLIYLLFVYEIRILRLHQPQRRHPFRHDAFNDIGSNRDMFRPTHPQRPAVTVACTQGRTGASQTCLRYGLYPSLSQVRRQIWRKDHTYNHSNGSKSGLPDLVFDAGDKSNYVNFANLFNPDRANTIEFRQQASTTDPRDIEEWVMFVLALVRLANSKARQTSELQGSRSVPEAEIEGSKYPFDELDGTGTSLETLMEMMEFEPVRQSYWIDRMRTFDVTDNDIKVLCDPNNPEEVFRGRVRNGIWGLMPQIREERYRNAYLMKLSNIMRKVRTRTRKRTTTRTSANMKSARTEEGRGWAGKRRATKSEK